MRHWGSAPRWIACGYIIGFVEGMASHVNDEVRRGLHAYSAAPLAFQVFFHALLVLDPLVVVLIYRARPAGPVLAAAVMVLDVAANGWDQRHAVAAHPMDFLVPYGLLVQALFMVFVLTMARPLWITVRHPSPRLDGCRTLQDITRSRI